MVELQVRLKNPSIILMPITEEEKECLEKRRFVGNEAIYVLYKIPNCERVFIGMMAASTTTYFSGIANVWNLQYATEKAYFYNGGSELQRTAEEITDRPVYQIEPTDDRFVDNYAILNGTTENGFMIPLDDVLDGKFQIKEKELPIQKSIDVNS